MKICYIILSLILLSSCSENFLKPSPEINVVENKKSCVINLPENHTTGYTWQLIKNYDTSKVDYTNAVWHGNEKGVYHYFETKAAGNFKLNFALINYTDTSSFETFEIEVK